MYDLLVHRSQVLVENLVPIKGEGTYREIRVNFSWCRIVPNAQIWRVASELFNSIKSSLSAGVFKVSDWYCAMKIKAPTSRRE